MKPAATPERKRCHELPLVLFTSLAIAGGGLAAGHPLAWALGISAWCASRKEAGAVSLLLGVGFLLSTLHLGRPSRSVRALSRTGQSWLSTEVLLGLVSCTASFFSCLSPGSKILCSTLWGIASFSSLGLLISVALVYRLAGQLSWGGASLYSPPVLGLTFGLVVHVSSARVNTAAALGCISLFVADACLWIARVRSLRRNALLGEPAHPAFFMERHRILAARIVTTPLVPLAALLSHAHLAAMTSIAVGIVLDRVSFYGCSLRQTTEAEIARVEALLKSHLH